jgi:hypothetical protein
MLCTSNSTFCEKQSAFNIKLLKLKRRALHNRKRKLSTVVSWHLLAQVFIELLSLQPIYSRRIAIFTLLLPSFCFDANTLP